MLGTRRTFILAVAASIVAIVAVGWLSIELGAQASPRAWIVIAVAGLSPVLAGIALWRYRVALRRSLADVDLTIASWARGELERGAEFSAGDETATLTASLETLKQRMKADAGQRDYLDRLMASMSEAIIVTGADGRILSLNPAAAAMTGYDAQSLLGRAIDEIIKDDDRRRSDGRATTRPREGVFHRSDGSTVAVSYTTSEVQDNAGKVESLVYAAQDIEYRKRIEQRIRYLARTDALTKIANRMQFQHLLQQSIAKAKRRHQYLALLYLDVDRFKDINDTFGHAAGDTSLEIFARRLADVMPEGAIAGRLAGDEFAVLVGSFDHMSSLAREVTETAQRLLTAIGRPFVVHGEEIYMTTSIGIALYPRDGDNVVDLLRNGDAALYHAKQAGGNCFEFYSRDMNTEAEERLMLKSKLRRAFEREELRLHYQPKYSLKSGRIEGAEALVRWDLPERGLVYPSDFIPLAEETNLILQIGDWVLNQVCADYRQWQRFVPSPCRVSLNLSLRQLRQQRFLDGVRKAFRSHGVSPTCLELEITETTLMEDADRTIRILDALYGMGLHLAIDDFGTGYSSLSALQQFPISTLKIDQSFIRDLDVDKDDAAIVRTIIQMAHSLKLEVVAEGVESQWQLDYLREQGCDYAQGHLFGDPVTSERFCSMLTDDAEGSGRYQALFA